MPVVSAFLRLYKWVGMAKVKRKKHDQTDGLAFEEQERRSGSSLILFPVVQNELKICRAIKFAYLHPIDCIDNIWKGAGMEEQHSVI